MTTATAPDLELLESTLRDSMQAMADAQTKVAGVEAIQLFEHALGELLFALDLDVIVDTTDDKSLINSNRVYSRGERKGQIKQALRMTLFQSVSQANYDLGVVVSEGLTVFEDLYAERWPSLPDDGTSGEDTAADADDDGLEDESAEDVESAGDNDGLLGESAEPARRFTSIKRNAGLNHPELVWLQSVGDEWGKKSESMPVGAMESWHAALDAWLPVVRFEWGSIPEEWLKSGGGAKMLHVAVKRDKDGGLTFNLCAVKYLPNGAARNLPANNVGASALTMRLWESLEAETIRYLEGDTAQMDLFDEEWESERVDVGQKAFDAAVELARGRGAGDAPAGDLLEGIEPEDDDLDDEDEEAAAIAEAEEAAEADEAERDDAEADAEAVELGEQTEREDAAAVTA